MATANKIPQLKYEPEADVLSWEVSDAPIEYASEIGDMIVHFTKDNRPVLIEVLRAKDFMRKAEGAVGFKRVHPEMAMA